MSRFSEPTRRRRRLAYRAFEASAADARQTRARTLATLFAAGATLSTFVVVSTMLLSPPMWIDLHRAGILITVVAAASVAIYLWVRGAHIDATTCHVTTVGGSVLIASCQVLAGGLLPAVAYAQLYVWVVLHASMFFGLGAVRGHLVVTTVLHAVALRLLGLGSDMVPVLVLVLGTQVAAAYVVSALASHLHHLADVDRTSGLINRRGFDRRLEDAVDRARRRNVRTLTVAVVAAAAQTGQWTPQQIHRHIVNACKGQLRASDVVAQLDASTYAIVLEHAGSTVSQLIARRLLRALSTENLDVGVGLAALQRKERGSQVLDRAVLAARDALDLGQGISVSGDGPSCHA